MTAKTAKQTNFPCRLKNNFVDMVLPGQGIIECNSKVAMLDHLGYSFTIDVNVQRAGRHAS